MVALLYNDFRALRETQPEFLFMLTSLEGEMVSMTTELIALVQIFAWFVNSILELIQSKTVPT